MQHLRLDMTPYVRGPATGIGRVANESAKSIEKYLGQEFKIQRLTRTEGQNLKTLGLVERLMGKTNAIFYSFEHRIPPALRSIKILTVHDCWTLWPNKWQESSFQRRQAKLLARAIKRADQIVVPTTWVKEELLHWDSSLKNKVALIPWGPTIEQPSENPWKPSADKFFLVVGVFEHRKNHALIVKALKKISTPQNFVFVGSKGFGAEEIIRNLESLRPKHSIKIKFETSESELLALYKTASALILPSHEEGFGLPALEAMSLGCPVILSGIAPLEEIAGQAALYVDPKGDGESLVARMTEVLIKTVSETCSERGFERSKKFSWDHFGQKVAELIRRFIS